LRTNSAARRPPAVAESDNANTKEEAAFMKSKLILCAAALAAVVAPAVAADDEGGFFVGVEANFVQPTNLGSGYALVDPNDNGEPEGKIRSAEFSNEFTPEIWIGQAYGNGSGWVLGFWSFDEKARDRVSNPVDGELWDILFNADDADDNYVGTASALNEVQADSLQLVYWRNIAGNETYDVSWHGGLRYASFEHMLDVDYRQDFDQDGTIDGTEDVTFTNESDGIGITTGLRGSARIGSRVKLYAGASYSMLRGTIEATSFADEDGSISNDVSREEDRSISIFDVDLGVGIQVAENWWVKAGYEFAQWNNVMTRDTFPDDVSEGFIDNTNTDVSWDGFTVGVGVMF
jgi:opacity protein-like surface antigen